MKVSGFTFVRNVVKYDYPVVESIRSVLPVVDEFIVNVGRCDDGTLEMESPGCWASIHFQRLPARRIFANNRNLEYMKTHAAPQVSSNFLRS